MRNRDYFQNNQINQFNEIIDEDGLNDMRYFPINNLDIIKEQSKYSVCKIVKENNHCGTGFICLIPFPSKAKQIPVLITCNHVLLNEDIKYGKAIQLIFIFKSITLYVDKLRRIYTNNYYDITIIEIKEDDDGFDRIHINNILELDYDIMNKEELNNIYKNESIYIIHYPLASIASFSYGLIQNIDSNNVIIEYKGGTNNGSSGAPIFNLTKFKVIGIHRGKEKINDNKLGIILRKPIEEFYSIEKYKPIEDFFAKKKHKKENSLSNINCTFHISEKKKNNKGKKPVDGYNQCNKKSEINLKIKVSTKDIDKKVYFLDNTNFADWFTKKRHFHDFLKELDESNTKVYINGNEIKYNKYFIPKVEGIYDIKIVINIKMKNCSFMFSDCGNITEIDLSSFDASDATDISHMFYECYLLKNINFRNFNTNSVVNMSYMFVKCTRLEELDISSFNINKVDLEKNMKDLFLDCKSLLTVIVNNDSSAKIKKKLKPYVNLIII